MFHQLRFIACVILTLAICTALSAQVTITATCSPTEGWMADGWGGYKFIIKNTGKSDVKLTKWTACWEANGKTVGDSWGGDLDLTVPSNDEVTKDEVGYLPPDIVKKAKPGNPFIVGSFTAVIDGKTVELPYRVEVPEATLPEPTKLLKGKYIGLEIMQSRLAVFKEQDRLVQCLDHCYEAMHELTGYSPYNGAFITIKEAPAHPWYAYAGNPIIMNTKHMENTLKEVDNGVLPFGWIHEVGHDFDDVYGKWYMWDGPSCEWQANWKLTYAYETIPDRDYLAKWSKNKNAGYQPASKDVLVDAKQFIDSFFLFFGDPYLSDPTRKWDTMSSDEIHSFFLRLVRVYGWEPFKAWYRTYARFEKLGLKEPETPEGKIQLIAAILSEETGVDLVPVFQRWRMPVTEQDVQAMKAKYPIGNSTNEAEAAKQE
ncbi:MAG TPA: M60 family metallopeptidase [Armatimonadota bacterium]|nr:M60 family metallopeptidase [Armatimonadota bacterium]HPP73583.1 M60 family metallopeptidase [Armatimonadota bacterium]